MKTAVNSTAVFTADIKPKGHIMSKKQKQILYCPNCSKELQKNPQGTTYCPNCGQVVNEKDADKIDPRFAKELR